ncbi:MAG: hypothetical protein WC943_06385 [Elusimicrobiota bacterium]
MIDSQQLDASCFEPIHEAIIAQNEFPDGGIAEFGDHPARFREFGYALNCLEDVDDEKAGVLGGVFLDEFNDGL